MSLLMEALKKAERAKQGQSDQPVATPDKQNPASAPPVPKAELSLQPQEQAEPESGASGHSEFPPLTPTAETDAIPELKLEAAPIQQETTPRVEPTLAAPELSISELEQAVQARTAAAPASSAPAQPTAAASSAADSNPKPAANALRPTGARAEKAPAKDERTISAAQQAARTVFAAKAPARNRTVLIVGAAAAVLIGLAGFAYYYWQLVSPNTMVIPAAGPQQAAMPVAPGQAGGAPAEMTAPAGAAATSPAVPAQTAALPGTPEKTVQPSADTDESAQARMRSEPEPFRASPAIQIRQSIIPSQINPLLSKAYQAYQAGDTVAAQQHYQKVLQQDANNRDALLGMAAIALSRKQAGQAAALYARLLELDPADPEALAGLISVQGQTDPVQSESRLKKILAQSPQAAAVHFALGNVYSQQSRWAEAQQSYFRAYSSAPANADYAFNLAVSLDFLNQGKQALEYYQRALNLAKSGPANFDTASAQNRIKELQKPVEE